MAGVSVLSLILAFVILFVAKQWSKKTVIPKGLRELPGPKGYPIIGNLRDFPKEKAYQGFHKMAKHYGPIFKLNIFGDTHVIISTQKIADDLMARRGAIYSDRGHLNMVHLVTGSGDLLASSSEGDYWRRGRRFSAAMLTPAKAAQWQPFQEQAAKRMIIDMVESPSRYVYWFDRYATTVSLRECYGKVLTTTEEEELHTHKIAERMHNIERIATPGGYLVELIPAMMYIPECLAPFKQEAKELHRIESTYFRQLVHEARLKYERNVEEMPASFVRCFFEDEKWELTEPEVTYILGTLYGGGSGTTANAMQSFILAMCHYPSWQNRLQSELDEVVGSSRVPSFEDIPRLPLVRAVAKEVLRWRPVVPGNLPHRLTRDDEYEGYYIPKGAIIHGNQWAIHRDEELYPDSENFNPSRFLEKEYPTYKEPLDTNPNIKRFSAFGFGRRICPGLETADRSLFIQIAFLAWACHVTKKTDAAGKEIPVPWYDYTEGSNVMPNKFDFDLKPRSQERMEIIRASLS
ncbi:predicted protein [Paecilomyces variotii No. 5]|uniref:Cytochrome P450 n=1 Tax=Byssochlamys spectabilis (strain No. 5 / NBRC 109023) TaxID=1356009 RepID=V5G511_BYSSN|nr:predicted protein [Paecilomyces variotii No. 5]